LGMEVPGAALTASGASLVCRSASAEERLPRRLRALRAAEEINQVLVLSHQLF